MTGGAGAMTGARLISLGLLTPPDLSGLPDSSDSTGRPGPDGDSWFDPAAHLGPRGWKYLSPATRYLLAAANLSLGRGPGTRPSGLPGYLPEQVGVVTGTHHAISALHARLDRTLSGEGPRGLSPAELPGFSVNTPASQLAITVAAKAFCVTLTNPVVAGTEAVIFALAALRRGRARRVVAAATEASGPGLAWSGAAALVLDAMPAGDGPAGDGPEGSEGTGCPGPAAPLGEVLAGTSRFIPPGPDRRPDPEAAAAAARRVAALASEPGDLRYVFAGPDPTRRLDEAVQLELRRLGRPPVSVGHLSATAGAVSGFLQLAAALREPGPALVVTASGAGHVAALALRSAPVPLPLCAPAAAPSQEERS